MKAMKTSMKGLPMKTAKAIKTSMMKGKKKDANEKLDKLLDQALVAFIRSETDMECQVARYEEELQVELEREFEKKVIAYEQRLRAQIDSDYERAKWLAHREAKRK